MPLEKEASMKYGYARVSTDDQTPALQLDALAKAGCEKTYTDHGVSGVAIARPQLDRLLKKLQPGDVLVCWRLDRLGRSLAHLIAMIEDLRKRGVGFHSLSESIDTTTAQGKLVFHMMAALAEFERSLMQERTSAGRAAAKKRGVKFGRPKKLDVVRERHAIELRSKGVPVPEIAAVMGVSRWSIYRMLRDGTR
jgi:DNA invertase Pin-like site-specific DNA recombinase